MKLNKNDKTLTIFVEMAKKYNIDLNTLLLSDSYLTEVVDVFYAAMPKLVRMTMNKNKFSQFYVAHREEFVKHIIN